MLYFIVRDSACFGWVLKYLSISGLFIKVK